MNRVGASFLIWLTLASIHTVLCDDGRVTIPVAEGAFDSKTLLAEAEETLKNITILIEDIGKLKANINSSKLQSRADDLVKRLGTAKERLVETNSTITSLSAATASANFNSTIELFSKTFTCFASSGCVGPKTTTMMMTTTTAPITKCESQSLTSSETEQSLSSPPSGMVSNYNCSDTIRAAKGYNVSLNVALTVSGNAWLRFVNMDNNEQIGPIYNGTRTNSQETNARNVKIEEFAGGLAGDGIKYKIDYKSVDACFQRDCKQGVCVVQPDGSPLCTCDKCISTDASGQCTVGMNPCTPSVARKCGKGKCEIRTDSAKCMAGCVCEGQPGYQTFCA